MTIEIEYSTFVRTRAKILSSVLEDVLHGAVGVSGEAGELLDSVKKSWIYGKPLDYQNILEECGDLCFYIQHILNQTGHSFDDLMRMNMEKLRKRYPDGYSDAAAIARADKAHITGEVEDPVD